MKVMSINNTNCIGKIYSSEHDKKQSPSVLANLSFLTSSNYNSRSFVPVFRGVWFENNVVKQVKGKQYQGLGLYDSSGKWLDFNKVGDQNLKNEPIDIRTATDEEVYAYYHALSLAETNDTTWVRRYNNHNVTKPLAVFHTLNSQKAEQGFANNLNELLRQNRHASLDVPITDEDGKLCINCTVFDTETTGTNIADSSKPLDKIIQIGAIQVKNGDIIEGSAYNQLINPEMHIPEQATNVHGITDEMIEDQPTIEKVLKPFINNYLTKQNGVIVAYNSKFDMTLLNNAIREHNEYSHEPLKERRVCKVLDPFILMQRIHPYIGARKRLGEQYKFLFCKNMDNAHDAFADVKGTVDVLKYTLYYLSEHRRDKSKPLTLREVLVFQNGGIVENIDIPLDVEGCNSRVKFKKSYIKPPVLVDNYFRGYKLTKSELADIEPLIGEENVKKLKNEKVVGKDFDLNPKDAPPINPMETKSTKNGGMENAFYVMKHNFQKVLDLSGIDAYGELSKQEVVDLITEHSKDYVHKDCVNLWMKNADPNDIKDGNDLPDINLARKVMIEDNLT